MLRENKLLLLGLLMLFLLVAAMVVSPFIVPEEALNDARIRFSEEGEIFKAPFPPNTLGHILGTDYDGKDILSMLLAGTKDTILIIFSITALRYLIAVPLGIYASKNEGLISFMLKGWNTFFTSIPTIFSAILLINLPFFVFLEMRTFWVIILLAMIEVGRVGHIIKEQGYEALHREFSIAGRVQGMTSRKLIFHHVFPYIMPNIIMNFFLDLGRVTLLIAQLGLFSVFVSIQFLESDPGIFKMEHVGYNWTSMLGDTKSAVLRAPWIPFTPAMAILYTVLTFNIIGEGIKRNFMRREEYL